MPQNIIVCKRSFLNPVLCALAYLESLEMEDRIDTESFKRVSEAVGEKEEFLKHGFRVEGMSDLNRLCEIGNFVIAMRHNGVVSCMTPEEWQQHEHRR